MMPPEHAGHTHTRKWYKVKWVKKPSEDSRPSEEGKSSKEDRWNDIVGKTDIIMDEDFQGYKDCVEIIEELKADTCAILPTLSFGKMTENEIDNWIKQNKK